MASQSADNPSLRRVWITWSFAALCISIIAVAIYVNDRAERLDKANQRLMTESAYLKHILADSLRAGEFLLTNEQVQAWGQLNKDTRHISLTSDTGFVIAEFERPQLGGRTISEKDEILFSYSGIATLILEKSLGPVNAAMAKLGWQLFGAALVTQFFSLVLIYQLASHRRQVRATEMEYLRRLKMQRAMEKMATHDALTGLPNRYQLNEQLRQRIAEARRFGRKLAVLFIDLDNFKQTNDTFGHEIGDELLRISSQRMLDCLRNYDVLARFGGDEFVVILTNITDSQEIDQVAQKLIETMRNRVSLSISKADFFVSATIGISLFPNDGDEPGDLLSHADAAMYTAKDAGKDCYRFYTAALNRQLAYRQKIEIGLHQALENGELALAYQPKLDLQTGAVRSCEALLRWHRDEAEVSPGEFIPIAEGSILMRQIEAFVIDAAVRQSARWRDKGISNLRIDINLSGRRLLLRETFQQLEEARSKHGVAASQIGVELTEHSLIEANEETIENLNELRRHGGIVSLDDFGTGYSSLGYLKQLPVDVLKIDRAFIKDLPGDEQDRSIVAAIVAMGQSLGKRILAEGVETGEQLEYVKRKGCDLAQGFIVCRPLPADELEMWIKDQPQSECQSTLSRQSGF